MTSYTKNIPAQQLPSALKIGKHPAQCSVSVDTTAATALQCCEEEVLLCDAAVVGVNV